MISQQELPAYIEKSMPELSGICTAEHCENAYDIARQMLKFTKNQITQHNMKSAKKCLELADKLYTKGNMAIKSAIENVFVYSFSHAFFYNDEHKSKLMDIVPSSLYNLYKKQVIYSHL